MLHHELTDAADCFAAIAVAGFVIATTAGQSAESRSLSCGVAAAKSLAVARPERPVAAVIVVVPLIVARLVFALQSIVVHAVFSADHWRVVVADCRSHCHC